MLGEGTTGQVIVVRGPEEEDSFRGREIKGGICPGCGRAGVGIACVSGSVRWRWK